MLTAGQSSHRTSTGDMIQFLPINAEISDRKINVKEHDRFQSQRVG